MLEIDPNLFSIILDPAFYQEMHLIQILKFDEIGNFFCFRLSCMPTLCLARSVAVLSRAKHKIIFWRDLILMWRINDWRLFFIAVCLCTCVFVMYKVTVFRISIDPYGWHDTCIFYHGSEMICEIWSSLYWKGVRRFPFNKNFIRSLTITTKKRLNQQLWQLLHQQPETKKHPN